MEKWLSDTGPASLAPIVASSVLPVFEGAAGAFGFGVLDGSRMSSLMPRFALLISELLVCHL